jgi:pimeloyl-CoA synthetase
LLSVPFEKGDQTIIIKYECKVCHKYKGLIELRALEKDNGENVYFCRDCVPVEHIIVRLESMKEELLARMRNVEDTLEEMYKEIERDMYC